MLQTPQCYITLHGMVHCNVPTGACPQAAIPQVRNSIPGIAPRFVLKAMFQYAEMVALAIFRPNCSAAVRHRGRLEVSLGFTEISQTRADCETSPHHAAASWMAVHFDLGWHVVWFIVLKQLCTASHMPELHGDWVILRVLSLRSGILKSAYHVHHHHHHRRHCRCGYHYHYHYQHLLTKYTQLCLPLRHHCQHHCSPTTTAAAAPLDRGPRTTAAAELLMFVLAFFVFLLRC